MTNALIRQNRILQQQLDETRRLLMESNSEILDLTAKLVQSEMQKEDNELRLEIKRLRRGNDQQRKTIIRCRNIMAQLRTIVAVSDHLSNEKVLNNLLFDVQRILENRTLSQHQKSMEIKARLDRTRKLRLRNEA